MSADYTDAQKDCLKLCAEMLGEHFDSYTLSVLVDIEFEGKNCEMSEHYWSGGRMACLGLLMNAQSRIMMHRKLNDDDPERFGA